MTPAQTAELLTIVAAYDRRTLGDADVLAWSLALDDVDLADAKRAVVAHYRESRVFLMPSDVRALVRASRPVRPDSRSVLEAAPLPEDAVPCPPTWQELYEAGRAAAAGRYPQRVGKSDLTREVERLAAQPPQPQEVSA